MLEYALNAINNGLSVVPPREDGSKAPIMKWQEFQKTPPTANHIIDWYTNDKLLGIGVVTGAVSGNLEVLDFDNMAAYTEFCQIVTDYGDADLWERVCAGYLESSPKGMHVLYRCPEIGKNQKLARRDKQVLIETRGEGGYIILAPSSGKVNSNGVYSLVRGSLETIATITPGERNILFTLAAILDAEPDKCTAPTRQVTATDKHRPAGQGPRPGDDFNSKHSWRDVLIPYGWQPLWSRGDVTHWRKPGSNKAGCHATTGAKGNDVFYCFSTEAHPFEGNATYSKFAALTLLEYNGDYGACASDLSGKGYGDKKQAETPPFIWGQDVVKKPPRHKSLAEVVSMPPQPIKWIVQDLIPEGCHILAGSPKIGKSFLAIDMALTISTPGRKMFGHFPVQHGKCLYLALEDSWGRIQDRTSKIMGALPKYHAQAAQASENAVVCITWPPLGAGCIEEMEQFLTDNPDTVCIIVDTLAKVRPIGGPKNSNAYEVDYAVVSAFQSFAIRNHIAIILITHLRKSSGAKEEDPFEQVTGSMGISGAADTTIRLKRGQNSDFAEFYIRGRDVEEQCLNLRSINMVWHYSGDKEDAPSHLEEIRDYVSESRKTEFSPSDFNTWYRKNMGDEIKGIRVIFNRLYDRGHLKKLRHGVYALH
jgi:hypothetical protein